MTCIAGVGIAFMVLLYTDYYGFAGVLEWTITYLGSLWLGTFAGYIRWDISIIKFPRGKENNSLTSKIDFVKKVVSPGPMCRLNSSLYWHQSKSLAYIFLLFFSLLPFPIKSRSSFR